MINNFGRQIVLLAPLFFILQGCFGEIDKKTISVEELELLYLNNNKGYLHEVCDGYYLKISKSTEEEDLIYGREYTKSNNQKFLKYCKYSYEQGRKKSACNIKDYYGNSINGQNIHFTKYILYLKKCGDSEEISEFLNNDALILAVIQSIPIILAYPQKGTLEEVVHIIKEKVDKLRMCEQDLKKVRGKISLFTGQYATLLTTVDNLKNSLYSKYQLGKELLRGHRGRDTSKKIDTANSNISRDFEDLVDVYRQVIDQTTKLDKNSLLKVATLLGEFKENKEKYLSKYSKF